MFVTKQLTRLERLARDKNSSLLRKPYTTAVIRFMIQAPVLVNIGLVRGLYYKTFYDRICCGILISESVYRFHSLYPSIIFVSEAGSYQRGALY